MATNEASENKTIGSRPSKMNQNSTPGSHMQEIRGASEKRERETPLKSRFESSLRAKDTGMVLRWC